MEPFISPLPRAEPSLSPIEKIRQQHQGTLNIFARNNQPEESQVPSAAHRMDHNSQSRETREFSWPHLRRVTPPQRKDVPQGIFHVPRASAREQNIQVVGVTAAYKDPNNMCTPRTGIRCSERTHSSSMGEVLGTIGTREKSQPRPSRPSSARSRIIVYSRQERFCQVVRDHAQHRRGGVTQFYVQLARGQIGRVAAQAPAPTLREWHLEDEPVTHTLTLASCREQLVSFVGIEVSLVELAELLWDIDELRAAMGGALDEDQLGRLTVAYKDFSVAFGDNSDNLRLATMKI